jgi:hypothetical protein
MTMLVFFIGPSVGNELVMYLISLRFRTQNIVQFHLLLDDEEISTRPLHISPSYLS